MSKRDDILLLEDINESCDKIFRYIENMAYEDFINDEKTIDAVIRNFEVIGEAANRLSDDIYREYNKVKWRQIIGLRNRLIHGYFGIDYKIVWTIIGDNLTEFQKQIKSMIK